MAKLAFTPKLIWLKEYEVKNGVMNWKVVTLTSCPEASSGLGAYFGCVRRGGSVMPKA